MAREEVRASTPILESLIGLLVEDRRWEGKMRKVASGRSEAPETPVLAYRLNRCLMVGDTVLAFGGDLSPLLRSLANQISLLSCTVTLGSCTDEESETWERTIGTSGRMQPTMTA